MANILLKYDRDDLEEIVKKHMEDKHNISTRRRFTTTEQPPHIKFTWTVDTRLNPPEITVQVDVGQFSSTDDPSPFAIPVGYNDGEANG